MKEVFLTDKEVAEVVRVSPRTLCSIVSGFVRGGDGKGHKTYGKVIDLAKAEPDKVGGYRRWNVSSLAQAIGIDVEAIYERLGMK